MPSLEALRRDARSAARSLRRNPVLAAVTALSLALGVGSATAVFTLANAMLLRPLPYPAAERLVVPYQTVTRGSEARTDTTLWTVARYRRLRELVPAFESAGFSTWLDMNVRGREATTPVERVRVEVVTASLLSTLHVRPASGRLFGEDEDTPGVAYTAALVSSRVVERGLAELGQTISLNGAPVTVVGVMPPGFTGFANDADVWVPLYAMPRLVGGPRWTERLESQWGTVIARVAPGVSLAVVRAQLAAAVPALDALAPERRAGAGSVRGAGVMRLQEARQHPLVGPLLRLLAAAVGAVLLIVCANLAGIFLARAEARRAEIGIRLANGARPGHIARQVLTESVLVAAWGAGPALLFAWFGAAALARLRPRLPQTTVLLRGTDLLAGVSLAPDWRVVAFALGLTLVAGLLVGVAPAVVTARTPTDVLLKPRGGSGARAHGRSVLVVAQVTLATILLVGAGLMARSLRHMLRTDLGFDADGVVVMRISSADTTIAARVRRESLLGGVAALDGVEAVATHGCVPFDNECLFTVPLLGDGAAEPDPDRAPQAEVQVVGGDFLRVMRVPLVAGRWFGPHEASGESGAVVVSRSAARYLERDGRPAVGRRILARGPGGPSSEVIGVVGDTRFSSIERAARPTIYVHAAQLRSGGAGQYRATLLVRTRRDPASVAAAVRGEIARTDPSLAVFGVATGRDLVRAAASSTRFVAVLLGGFALVAAFLAALGVYGVLAYGVARRRRELGVRIAIGATPARLLAHVMRDGVTLTAAGLALGIVGALAATAAVSRFLYGVVRGDAATYAAIVALMGLVGAAASLIPARRATRVDPAVTLRE